MEKNQLSIRLHGEHVGILEQTPTGKMIFTYDKNATSAISIKYEADLVLPRHWEQLCKEINYRYHLTYKTFYNRYNILLQYRKPFPKTPM